MRFVRPPKEESYGMVAVFEDLYGNLWDLLQLRERAQPIAVKQRNDCQGNEFIPDNSPD